MLIKDKDLNLLLLKPEATLGQAIIKMNSTKYKIIFIAGQKFFFFGYPIRWGYKKGASRGSNLS